MCKISACTPHVDARWYATTIGRGNTAINLVVAHTSVFIDGYLAKGSSYAVVDEEIAYVRMHALCSSIANAVSAVPTVYSRLYGYMRPSSCLCSCPDIARIV